MTTHGNQCPFNTIFFPASKMARIPVADSEKCLFSAMNSWIWFTCWWKWTSPASCLVFLLMFIPVNQELLQRKQSNMLKSSEYV